MTGLTTRGWIVVGLLMLALSIGVNYLLRDWSWYGPIKHCSPDSQCHLDDTVRHPVG